MPSVSHILETSLLVLLAYLLGCTLGYLARRILHAGRGTRQVGAASVPAAVMAAEASPSGPVLTPVARPAGADGSVSHRASGHARPAGLRRPRAGGADNLKQIKGIDAQLEASLYALGIFHLDQIAAWTRADVDWIEGHLALRGRIARENWLAQAKACIGNARLSA